jgi:hypothetical protein
MTTASIRDQETALFNGFGMDAVSTEVPMDCMASTDLCPLKDELQMIW